MAGPNLPVEVPWDVRQGSEEGYEATTAGHIGIDQTHRGWRRDYPTAPAPITGWMRREERPSDT